MRGRAILGYILVAVLTAGFVLLAARTIIGLADGTFFPRVAAREQT